MLWIGHFPTLFRGRGPLPPLYTTAVVLLVPCSNKQLWMAAPAMKTVVVWFWRSFVFPGLGFQRVQQRHQVNDVRIGFGIAKRGAARGQADGALGRDIEVVPGGGESASHPFAVLWNANFQAVHHFVTVQRVLNVFVVQQEPKLEARYRGNGAKHHCLFGVIAHLAVERGRQLERVEVGAMVITVEHGIDLLEGAWANLLVRVAVLKQVTGVLHYLDGLGAQFTRLHFDVGGVKSVRRADLLEVQRFGFAAFGDDQDAIVGGALILLSLQLHALALARVIVAGHQAALLNSPRNGKAPYRPIR